ncbi:hypothetical protein FBU30_000892 [Linnemannia zychae]|nr:hypothetical protein FBU30_000892 [Linnemannia zychae]
MYSSILATISAILISAIVVTTEAATIDIEMADIPFLPRFTRPKVTIKVGDTVRWTNKGIFPHTVDEGSTCLDLIGKQLFKSGPILPGGTFTHTFDTRGDFDYFCLPHCLVGTMRGKVIVE